MFGKKKLLIFITSLALLISLSPISAFAATAQQFVDMPEDWSKPALESAVANGLLNGMDGKILPNDNLTRAQMATIIVRAFGATVKGDISAFPDIKPSDWFSDNMAKAYQMGVIKGADGEMNPNAAITREEVFVILARALKLTPATAVNKSFTDIGNLSAWAKGETYSLINSGYINGSDGYLQPGANITRAEFAQIIYNIVKQYYNTAGTYTTASGGNLMINTAGVILKNINVTGDLIIGDGVGNGEVTLDNVKINGRLVVRGGGENSVIIRGSSSVSNVIVARVDGAVSVKVQGDANVEYITIDDGSDDMRIEGSVGAVEVAASGIVVNAAGATIENVKITGAHSTVVVGAGSTVKALEVGASASNAAVQVTGTITTVTTSAAGTQVTGSGTVTQVTAESGATGAKIETPSTKITVESGATGVTAAGDTSVPAGTTATNNSTATATIKNTTSGGGGGGDRNTSTPVTAVGVTGSAVVGAILTAAPTPSNATGSYQWQISDNGTDGWSNIGTNSSTYEIVVENQGKYIRVTFTASGSFTGTQTSSATAQIGASIVPTAKVSGLAFTDTDAETNEMGGTLTWTAPADVSNVTHYVVYASEDGTTTGAQIGTDVAVGTNQLVIADYTTYAAYIIVVAKNATGEALAANYASVAVTDAVSPFIAVANDGGIVEGSEATEVLTVTLGNDTFVQANVTTGNVTMTGLPAGITVGSVAYSNPTQIKITLAGNSTEDYDTNVTATVHVASAALTANGGEETATIDFVRVLEEALVAPITFITNDVDNTFSWSTYETQPNASDYEYSVDGGANWTTCTAKPQTGITGAYAAGQVQVRAKATLRNPASTVLVSGGTFTVTFSGLTANGTSGSVTTTELTLTFDVDPTSLAATDITVNGATKGALTGTGTTRKLAISGITVANGENVTVGIFKIASPTYWDVAVNVAPTPVTFSGLTANGTSGSLTTTALTLTFDVDPTSLAADDITVTGATKGALTGTGTTRTLAISGITVANGENVTVAIANPAGFAITPTSMDVAVNVQ